MPVTFAFQSIADVAGAGPAEKREKCESPINWGHSYWSRRSSLAFPVFSDAVEAFTVFSRRFEMAINAGRISSRTRTAAAQRRFGFFVSEKLRVRCVNGCINRVFSITNYREYSAISFAEHDCLLENGK
jgi:hypothetical protein